MRVSLLCPGCTGSAEVYIPLHRIPNPIPQADILHPQSASMEPAAWLETLPAHVRATYVTTDRPRPFQGPVFDRLLRGVGYPAADDLQQDVNAGFDMLGSAAGPSPNTP